MLLCESYSWGENKIHHRIEMKPTPTHPVPDLHRALKTLPLCTKCGNEQRDVMWERVRYVYTFMGDPRSAHRVTYLRCFVRTQKLQSYITCCFKQSGWFSLRAPLLYSYARHFPKAVVMCNLLWEVKYRRQEFSNQWVYSKIQPLHFKFSQSAVFDRLRTAIGQLQSGISIDNCSKQQLVTAESTANATESHPGRRYLKLFLSRKMAHKHSADNERPAVHWQQQTVPGRDDSASGAPSVSQLPWGLPIKRYECDSANLGTANSSLRTDGICLSLAVKRHNSLSGRLFTDICGFHGFAETLRCPTSDFTAQRNPSLLHYISWALWIF